MALVLQLFDADMALRAIQFCVNGFCKNVGGKKQGDFLSVHASDRRRIKMTIKTIFRRDDFREGTGRLNEERQRNEQRTN